MPTRDEMRAALGVRPWNRVEVRVTQRFGALVVKRIDPPEKRPGWQKANGNWCVCKCDCGQMRKVLAWRLVRGEIVACHRCGQLQRIRARGQTIRTHAAE